jgi:hypothetical protein
MPTREPEASLGLTSSRRRGSFLLLGDHTVVMLATLGAAMTDGHIRAAASLSRDFFSPSAIVFSLEVLLLVAA